MNSANPLNNKIHWLIIFTLFAFNICLGFYGSLLLNPFKNPAFSPDWWSTLSDNIYSTLNLFLMQGPIEGDNLPIHITRLLAPLATASALFQTVVQLVYERADLKLMKKARGHTLIFGDGVTARYIALYFKNRNKRVIWITPSENDKIASFCAEHKVLHLISDDIHPTLFKTVSASHATHIFIANDNDGVNIDLLVDILNDLPKNEGGDNAWLHTQITDAELTARLQQAEKKFHRVCSSKNLQLNFFNYYEILARHIFVKNPVHDYALLRGQNKLHLLFFGFDGMAEYLFRQALLTSPYPKFLTPAVTIIDPNPEAVLKRLFSHSPAIESIIDLTLVGCQFDGDLHEVITQHSFNSPPTTGFICFSDDLKSISTCLKLDELSERQLIPTFPIFMRRDQRVGFSDWLGRERQKDIVRQIGSFGAIDSEEIVERIIGDGDFLAKEGHTAYCLDQELLAFESLSPEKQKERSAQHHERMLRIRQRGYTDQDPLEGNAGGWPWHLLPETFKRANRRSTDHLPIKLKALGYHTPNNQRYLGEVQASQPDLEALGRIEHDRWTIDRVLDGWQYAPERDNNLQLHPSLIPYDSLSREEQLKDIKQAEFQLEMLAGLKGLDHLIRNKQIGIQLTSDGQTESSFINSIAHEVEDEDYQCSFHIYGLEFLSMSEQLALLKNLKEQCPTLQLNLLYNGGSTGESPFTEQVIQLIDRQIDLSCTEFALEDDSANHYFTTVCDKFSKVKILKRQNISE